MNWFKYYHEDMHDPNVQALRPPVFKFWINLLCLASKQRDRGTLPDIPDICYATRTREDHADKYLQELVYARLIGQTDSGELFIIGWDTRQGVPNKSAESPRERRPRRARSARAAELQTMSYEDYLNSPEWQARRTVALQLADYRCQACNAAGGVLDVHHRSYDRRGEEGHADVIVLCRDCHTAFHDNREVMRTTD